MDPKKSKKRSPSPPARKKSVSSSSRSSSSSGSGDEWDGKDTNDKKNASQKKACHGFTGNLCQ